jgi:hypothetical protein
MEKAQITYTVIKNDKGIIWLSKGGCYTPVRNIPENMGLLAALETDLEFALKDKDKDVTTS